MRKHLLYSLFLLILLGVIWGSGYPIIRYAVRHGVHPVTYAFWHALGPAIILFLFLIFAKRQKDSTSSDISTKALYFSAKHWIYYLVTGILGIVIPNVNIYFVAQHLPSGSVAVIVNTMPIMIYILAIITRQEKFNGWRLLSVILGLIGLFGLIYSRTLALTINNRWAWIALITPISLSLCVIYIARHRPPKSSSTQLAVGMLAAGTIILLPIMLGTHHFYNILPPINKLDWLIILSIFLSAAGYFILFELIKHAGAVFYSFVDTITSLTGLFWGYWIYHETLDWIKGIAIVFVLSAIILVSKYRQE